MDHWKKLIAFVFSFDYNKREVSQEKEAIRMYPKERNDLGLSLLEKGKKNRKQVNADDYFA